jgi:hypothetical protein
LHPIVDLQAATNANLAEHNTKPEPLVWKLSAASIFGRARQAARILSE